MEELKMTYAAMGLPFEFDSFDKLSARQRNFFSGILDKLNAE